MTTSRLVEALAAVCRERLLEEKWLLAPSLRVGHQWLDAATRTGQAAANVRVKTLKSMALDLAAHHVSANNLRLLSGRAGPLLVDRVFRRLKSQGLDYLGSLRASASLADMVYRSIQAVRLAGVDLDHAPPDRFEVRAKGRDVRRIVGAYVEALRTSRWIDYADVLHMAIQAVLGGRSVLPRRLLVLVPEDLRARGLEQRLLQALPAEQRVVLAADQPVGDDDSAEPEATDLALLRWLPRAGDAPPPVGDGAVEFFHAVGEVNEVREAFRRLAADGAPLDQVELICTDADAYASLIYETLSAAAPDDGRLDDDLPVTFADGLAVRFFRPGRLLAAWVQWIGEDFPQSRLVTMLREGLLASPDLDEKRFSFSRLAAVLRGIGIGMGKDRYLPKLDEEIAAAKQRLTSSKAADEEESEGELHQRDTRRLEELEVLRRLVARVLEVSPRAGAPPTEVLDGAARILETVARTVNKSDNFARQRLAADIAELSSWIGQDQEPAAMDIWMWLSQLPQEARVLGSGPRPGCIHVSNVLSGGHSGRRHTLIVGLDDARFPGAGSQDPLLLDAERERLSRELPTAASQLEERLRDFHRLLARLRGKLTLSFASRDLTDDREKFPSPVLLAAFRIASGRRDGSQEDFLERLGGPASFAPSDDGFCLDMRDWWLRQLCGAEPIRGAERLVLQNFPHLAQGAQAAAHKASSQFTAYDGRVEQAGLDLDPTKTDGPIMSSGRLEMIGQCPLKFFFAHGLDIQPPQEIVLDPTRWLDPPTAGALLHEVFEQFVRELIAAGEKPKFPDHLTRLDAILQSRVQVYRDLQPPPNEHAHQAQVAEFRRVIRTFLVEEDRYCSETGNQPAYLEASLGMFSHGEGSAIDTDQPIPIHLPDGRTLHVRGRVDRIDQIGRGAAGSYVIWDYKTGGAWKYEGNDPFQQGRVVQPAVYLAMVGHRLRQAIHGEPQVVQFGFFFPGRRDRGRRIQWTPRELAAGPKVLAGLADVVRNGAFLATNEANDCRYCQYLAICGDVEKLAAASAQKLAHPANTVLQPFEELRGCGQT